MKKINDCFELVNGVKIPCVGFGTWQAPDGETAYNSVTQALKCGYRHIDTAAAYKNEGSVGEAVKNSGISREEIFVTSKVWNKSRGYDTTLQAFDKTMNRLGLDYLDLYLIHWPANSLQFDNWDEINVSTWKALTELYKEGRIKAIGVSNFRPHHLKSLLETEVAPMVNQVEFHPGYMQNETVEFCRKNNILIEGWSPLGSGRVLEHEGLKKIAEKYGKSVAQICIKWCLQNQVLPLPKSVTDSRIAQNAKIFDFDILAEDMNYINTLPEMGFSGFDPDLADF